MHVVCMLNTFDTYESVDFYKYTASYGVICVTLIKIDKVASFHDPLKTLKLKTLASDCVMKRMSRQCPCPFIMSS